MADVDDAHRNYARRLWPDDAGAQLEGAHALAGVPPQVGWRVVAASMEDLRSIPDQLLTDEARTVLALPPADEVRACVHRIVKTRLKESKET